MRTFILSAAVLLCSATIVKAQTVSTFDTLHLPSVDTYYVNYTDPGTDQGFNDGLAHFPAFFDTSSVYGNSQYYGFSYSNKTDSVTSGYTNEYSAKTAIGYGGSANYAVAFCFDPFYTGYYAGNSVVVNLLDSAMGKSVEGCYITNSTYAYNSMKYGDAFESAFTNGDWFKLTVHGFLGGVENPDSVVFYLANFLHADTDSNYIVNTWQWVNLLPIGHVDSLLFSLTSSDTGMYGMNTPAYFCMDNFTTDETGLSVKNITTASAAKIYPIPAKDQLFIDIADDNVKQIIINNAWGQQVYSGIVTSKNMEINTSAFSPGVYTLELIGSGITATSRFVKE